MTNVNADGETLVNEPGSTRGKFLVVCKWIGGLALVCLIGYPAVKALYEPWQPASVDEIRTVIAESACAKKLLADANSSAQAITSYGALSADRSTEQSVPINPICTLTALWSHLEKPK